MTIANKIITVSARDRVGREKIRHTKPRDEWYKKYPRDRTNLLDRFVASLERKGMSVQVLHHRG